MIIFQIDRVKLTGRKNATRTQFPLKLDRTSQNIAGCGNQGTEYELQAVVVHQGTPSKGHYITFLKPTGGPHWAQFDDEVVRWVQEKGVLDQEATILVYTRPNHIVENDIITIPDDEQEDGSPPLDRGTTRTNHSGPAAQPPYGVVDRIFEKQTILYHC